MLYKTIILKVVDGVARLTLNRPERLNCFNHTMHEEFSDALTRIEQDKSIRVLLLTGNGKGFCAGQDLSERVVSSSTVPADLGESIEKNYGPMINRITSLPMPVVCGLNGVAAGAGVSMALAADIVIAAERAKFILSFAKLGLVPDSGGSWILPRLMGQARAMGLALTGDPISAQEAETWGMIWKCIDDERFSSELEAFVIQFSKGPTRGFSETKQLIRSSFSHTLAEQIELEKQKMRDLGYSKDYQEGVSAFLQKKKPEFTGK